MTRPCVRYRWITISRRPVRRLDRSPAMINVTRPVGAVRRWLNPGVPASRRRAAAPPVRQSAGARNTGLEYAAPESRGGGKRESRNLSVGLHYFD